MDAARRSLTRSALTEATRLLKRGLAALEKSPRGDHDLRLRMTALLGPALIALRGPGSAEAQELYANAYQLCQDSPDDVAQFPIYWGWWRVSRDFAASVERAKALLGRARLRADSGELLQAHHCAWASHFYVGALRRSRDHAMAGLALYEGGDYREQARLYGNHDAKVCAHGELCEIHWLQGRPSRARRHEREAIDWARRLNHLGSLLHALDYQLVHRAWGRDLAGTHGLAGDMIDLADEHALADYQAKALIFRGWAIAMGEDVAAGRAMLEEGIARQRDIGTEEDLPVYLSLLAEVLLRAGEAARAAAEVGEALARFDRTGLRVAVPELVRWHGEALAAERLRAAERSLARFAEASTIAEQQGADMLRLRASLSAARTLLRLGDPGQGARVLHPALEAMAEDDAGDDFREAAALMGRFRELGVALAVAR